MQKFTEFLRKFTENKKYNNVKIMFYRRFYNCYNIYGDAIVNIQKIFCCVV